MILLAELSEKVKLSRADLEQLTKVMSNGTVFKSWVAKANPGPEMLAKCLKYELTNPRVRADIFRSIVQRYNRQLADVNRVEAFKLLNRREVA